MIIPLTYGDLWSIIIVIPRVHLFAFIRTFVDIVMGGKVSVNLLGEKVRQLDADYIRFLIRSLDVFEHKPDRFNRLIEYQRELVIQENRATSSARLETASYKRLHIP